MDGCGGGNHNQTQSQTDFSLVAAPPAITVVPGGAAQTITVVASPTNGFAGDVAVTVGSLPAGVMAAPSKLSLAAGSQGKLSISASSSATPGMASIAVTGTSGTLTHSPTASVMIASPVTTASLSTTAVDCLKTWSQSTDTAGEDVSIFVAGMQASTLYHMQAAVKFSNGLAANDTDHTFTTKALPTNMALNVVTTTTAGMTPQPRLELLNPLEGTPTGVIVTDLSGNVLWTYPDPGNPVLNIINGVKNAFRELRSPAPAGSRSTK